MYVILTSKPGQFRTEADAALRVVETYDYMFYGSKKAVFQIAELEGETKVRIVEESPPHVVNLVPSKFLQKFDSLVSARKEIKHLATFGGMDISLVQRPQDKGAV